MGKSHKHLEFKGSRRASLGIEIEFQLLDKEGLDLADGILPLIESYPETPYIKPEMSQCTVEINSKVCTNLQELETDIIAVMQTLAARCQQQDLVLCGAGTHPFSVRPATITPLPRYRGMEKRVGYLAHIFKTFAFHIHVGMPSGDTTLAVMAMLKPYLPILLALSASSPFWEGHPTGFASFRQRVLAIMRDYGIPPTFPQWKDFVTFFENTQTAGVYGIIRDIHWDLRPRPQLGTLEIRVMDTQPTIKETMMLTALVHTLVVYLQHCCEQKECGYLLMPHHWWMEKMNHFRSSHEGVDANYIIDDQGHSKPMRAIIQELLTTLTPTAEKLGTAPYLKRLETHMEEGPSYLRQREVFKRTGSLKEVAAALAQELEQEITQ
ncbi:carboxylate-amine ligase [Nitrosococcus wardiae]|uniref:Putative glutamate--cysteine ligase 2 n=1 Tax=Nitrosococcus wardiae TaxID=1814290 RepID=A0A4P7C0H0_9GAMM|nr:YbdK family carboxylate-amine ligase [Nitrosococcus wardiae]QBQ55921.1 YbdK family carboxylate-amine ligase [Nitrosococcus wardiae]